MLLDLGLGLMAENLELYVGSIYCLSLSDPNIRFMLNSPDRCCLTPGQGLLLLLLGNSLPRPQIARKGAIHEKLKNIREVN